MTQQPLTGEPKLLDNGVWRVIGGTGGLERINSAGIIHIKAVAPQDREFALEGEIVVAKQAGQDNVTFAGTAGGRAPATT